MKPDGYDPGMRSACLYAERKRSAKASTLWLKKASVSSVIAQRKPAVLRILFPTHRLYVKLDVSRGKEFCMHPLGRHLWPRNNFVSLSDRFFSYLFCFKGAISQRKLLF